MIDTRTLFLVKKHRHKKNWFTWFTVFVLTIISTYTNTTDIPPRIAVILSWPVETLSSSPCPAFKQAFCRLSGSPGISPPKGAHRSKVVRNVRNKNKTSGRPQLSTDATDSRLPLRYFITKINYSLHAKILHTSMDEIKTIITSTMIEKAPKFKPTTPLASFLRVESKIETRYRSKRFASETLRSSTYFDFWFCTKKRAYYQISAFVIPLVDKSYVLFFSRSNPILHWRRNEVGERRKSWRDDS